MSSSSEIGIEMVGIDPDARGWVCCRLDERGQVVERRRFSGSVAGRQRFLAWLRERPQRPQVAIEGWGGESRPVERALAEGGLALYALQPAAVKKYREAVLGLGKSDRRDAEAVARFARSLAGQGRLEAHRRVWAAEEERQALTRACRCRRQAVATELNRLWKRLRQAMPDLYLALKGDGEAESGLSPALLRSAGLLQLLGRSPDPATWRGWTETDFLAAMGGGRYAGRKPLAARLTRLADRLPAVSGGLQLLLQTSAQQIGLGLQQVRSIKRELARLTADHPAVQALAALRGISVSGAAAIVAELIDVRRFPSNHHLASYAGLGRRQSQSGQRAGEGRAAAYNRRLKAALFTAAMGYVRYQPDSHLAAYFRHLRERGMGKTEAYKRVARALVRRIYRILKAVADSQQPRLPSAAAQTDKRREAGVANGVTRRDSRRESNTPAPAGPLQRSTPEAAVNGPTENRRRKRKEA